VSFQPALTISMPIELLFSCVKFFQLELPACQAARFSSTRR